jgi:hypothetical protein
MANAYASYSVDVNLNGFFAGLVTDATRVVQERVRRSVSVVASRTRDLVREAMLSTPEYGSILSGRLREEFGLADPGSVLASVIEAAAGSVQVEPVPASSTHLGGMDVGIFAADFSDFLSLSVAEYVSTNAKGQSHLIPWLRWLLFEGDTVVVQGFRVLRDGNFATSRTGEAIMGGKSGGKSSWRVPPEFAGTERNNWVTRVAGDVSPNVLDVMREVVLG